jgi:hypothetical protein
MSSRIPSMTNAQVMNIFKNPAAFQALSFTNKARIQHRVANINNSLTGLAESTHSVSRPSSASSYSPLMRKSRKNRKNRKDSRRANRKSRKNRKSRRN